MAEAASLLDETDACFIVRDVNGAGAGLASGSTGVWRT
jgi:hypothetical protein